MSDTKILQAILNKVNAVELKVDSLEHKVEKGFNAVDERFDKTDERITKLGLSLANLSDDAPTTALGESNLKFFKKK